MRSVIETGARFLLDPAAETRADAAFRPTRRPGAADRILPARHPTAPPSWEAIAFRSGRACSASRCPAGGRWIGSSNGLDKCSTAAPGEASRSASSPSRACSSTACRAMTELLRRLGQPNLRLTLDIGHLHCQGEPPLAVRFAVGPSRLVERAPGRHASGGPRAPDVWRGRNRFPARLAGPGRGRVSRRRVRGAQPP